MKKLTNVSPFLLLLVPVFVMSIFTVAFSTPTPREEAALGSSAKETKSITKVAADLLR